jgi:hypothetical protein
MTYFVRKMQAFWILKQMIPFTSDFYKPAYTCLLGLNVKDNLSHADLTWMKPAAPFTPTTALLLP